MCPSMAIGGLGIDYGAVPLQVSAFLLRPQGLVLAMFQAFAN
uniref:Uncharacterized protein n=1 Tax=Arundo donax TaxID=35708 RepID=A0A0A9A5S1_ARUDO